MCTIPSVRRALRPLAILVLLGPGAWTYADIPPARLLLDAAPLAATDIGHIIPAPTYFTLRPHETIGPEPAAPDDPLLLVLDSQVLSGQALEDTGRYLDAIDTAAVTQGPFAEELLPQFYALGLAYQRENDHEAALEALGKAEYLSRINHGLLAREQVGIVEHMITSYLALGDLGEARQKQQYLLYLVRETYGTNNPHLGPLLHKQADQNMDTFHQVLRRPPEFTLSMNFNTPGRWRSATPRDMAFSNLYSAQNQYQGAIMNMVRNRDYFNPRLLELELKLLGTLYLGANRQGLVDDPDFHLNRRYVRTGSHVGRTGQEGNVYEFHSGRRAWSRMEIYQRANPESGPLDIADTLLGQADWHILFDRRAQAQQLYRQVYDYLLAEQVPAERIDAIFDPVVPVQLPSFAPLPYSRARHGISPSEVIDYDGWIDVRFRLSRWGRARSIDILDTSSPDSKRMVRQLRRLLTAAPFRPRIVDGVFVHNEEVAVRYYYKDMGAFQLAAEHDRRY